MTRIHLQTPKRLRYRVTNLEGKEILKTYSRRIAIALACDVGGIVSPVR